VTGVPDDPGEIAEPSYLMQQTERHLAEQAIEYAELKAQAPPGLEPVRLVPVEVFGTDQCCYHGSQDEACDSRGYGLSDAVPAWSDCNRARGRIYRVDDLPGRMPPDPGEPPSTVVVYVRPEDRAWFELLWGDAKLEAEQRRREEAERQARLAARTPTEVAIADQLTADFEDEVKRRILYGDGGSGPVGIVGTVPGMSEQSPDGQDTVHVEQPAKEEADVRVGGDETVGGAAAEEIASKDSAEDAAAESGDSAE
jgi:hypothetical protein